jgi:shikimate kinase
MGSGKSAVGRELAVRLGVPFVDLDAELGDVPALFSSGGEAGFRAAETACLARLVGGDGVMALGGGTVVSAENRALLVGWRLFVLTAAPETLRARIGGGEGRPLAGRLEEILAERAEIYRTAGEPVATDDRSVVEVAADLVRRVGYARALRST